ncbi:MAG TPA: ABC transporter ATP-binding protein [Gammaproteobacteria bacterium]|nr:ABC transporter ATP-binding protein [Gammaproteobacteria bacterium]
MTLLETHALEVAIGGTTVCRGLDLAINTGERWCILGRNGAGKTTLLLTLAGLRSPESGRIEVQQQALNALPRRQIAQVIGILFQEHTDVFPANVLDTVLTGRHPWLGPLQWEGDADRRLARDALQAVGLSDIEARLVTTLSGGERRRLGIATLLAQDPRLLLLDEPTNHLDIHYQIRILQLVSDLAANGNHALLLVMHDINLATRYCNRFLLLFGDGETVQGSASDVLTQPNLERLYQHPLLPLQGPQGQVWIPQ